MPSLLLDGANGVGAIKMKELLPHIQDVLKVQIYNDGNGILNHNCGADFVKVTFGTLQSLILTH